MAMTANLTTVDALVADIPDGALVAAMKDTSGAPMALARALIRKGVRNLHLVCMPTGGQSGNATFAVCTSQGLDIGQTMVMDGWAVANPWLAAMRIQSNARL